MKEQSIYDFYAFGFNYNFVKQSLKDITAADVRTLIKENYYDKIIELELPVTLQVIKRLGDQIDKVDFENPMKSVPENITSEMEKIIMAADPTLDAELELRKVMLVTPKRFNEDFLLKDCSKLLAVDTWDLMSDNAKLDFSSAAACIAFNQPTAAAFHAMRSVEEMVKQLYFTFVRHNRLKQPMWGQIVTKLRTKNHPKPADEVLDSLDILRKNYRNPTQHPEKYYSIDEAQDLLHSSIVSLNQIVAEILTR